jgi:hypothetical protein
MSVPLAWLLRNSQLTFILAWGHQISGTQLGCHAVGPSSSLMYVHIFGTFFFCFLCIYFILSKVLNQFQIYLPHEKQFFLQIKMINLIFQNFCSSWTECLFYIYILLFFMNKMFILYFAWNNIKKNIIYIFMFKYVERRKFIETTSESASYT